MRVGGALLGAAIIDPQQPTWQAASLLLGGSAALLTHGAKASARAEVDASPEPFSNIALSLGEDVTTGGLLVLAMAYSAADSAIALLDAGSALALLWRWSRGIAGTTPSPASELAAAGLRRRSLRR